MRPTRSEGGIPHRFPVCSARMIAPREAHWQPIPALVGRPWGTPSSTPRKAFLLRRHHSLRVFTEEGEEGGVFLVLGSAHLNFAIPRLEHPFVVPDPRRGIPQL